MADPQLLQRYQELKSQHAEMQQQIARAEGALQEHLKRLQSEHGCKSIKAARQKHAQLDQEVQAAESEFVEAISLFEQKWSQVLG